MLCIEPDIPINLFTRHTSACNYTFEDTSDDIYSTDCGGENAYNIFETQGCTNKTL